jgi:hypothetical protein
MRLHWLSLSAALFLACGGAERSLCVTACGAEIYGVSDCSAAQAAEDTTMAAFAGRVTENGMGPEDAKWNTSNMCETLRGARYDIFSDEEFYKRVDRRAKGIAIVEERHVYLLRKDTWGASSYAHETAHLFDFWVSEQKGGPVDCAGTQACDDDHPLWGIRNVYLQVHAARTAQSSPMAE